MDFSNKILILRPATFLLGRSILLLGLGALIVGVVTYFTGEFLLPANAWLAAAIPTSAIGGILVGSSVTRP
jgi:hypothetical protein